MNLTIDIGNTLIKMAVFDGGEIVEKLLAEECDTKLLDGLLARWPAIDRAIIASTGGRTAPLARMLRVRAVKCLEFTPATPVPIRNGYDTPETLGADRLAAAVGAALVAEGRAALVVDFGTAITVDYVSGDGTYRGGAISPGMGMRFQALHRYTARLPLCRETAEERLYGTTTTSCIEQGVMNGIAFEIEGYIARFRRENADICIIFTGGAAKNFAKRIKNAIFADCELVFLGLNRILEFNAEC